MKRTLRATALVVLALALASCSRQVPLRIGPLSLVMGLALLEVRVWNGGGCPADARTAADPATLEDVAVASYFTMARDAPAVGAVPAGAHAVSVIVRDSDCQIVLYGCTPNVDFGTASAVNVTWTPVPSGLACEPGYACDTGACYEPRDSDAGVGDGG